MDVSALRMRRAKLLTEKFIFNILTIYYAYCISMISIIQLDRIV